VELSPIAEESFNELLVFLRFFRHFGTPIIIGGWAVYFYNPFQGSNDIDVIGPSLRGQFSETITQFKMTYGYTPRPLDVNSPTDLGLEYSLSKKIVRDGVEIGEMEIDGCSYESCYKGFHEDNSKELPYSLCEGENCRQLVTIDKDCKCYVPSKALLTLFKTKALRDREHDLRTKSEELDSRSTEWLRTKIAKDKVDIISLFDPFPEGHVVSDKINPQQLLDICEKQGITDLVRQSLTDLVDDSPAQDSYKLGTDSRTLKEWMGSLGSPFLS